MPQFDASTFPSQIFWLILCFLSLCWVMARHLLPAIYGHMEHRARRIQQDLEHAEEVLAKAEKLAAFNSDHLLRARVQATHILKQASEETQNRQQDVLENLDKNLTTFLQTARQGLINSQKEITGQLFELVLPFILAAAAKILPHPPTITDVKEIYESIEKER